MRTTLTLDDDVAAKLKDYAGRKRIPFREAVNSLLRRGLVAQEGAVPPGKPYRVETFSSPVRPGVDPQRLNQLLDDLEVEDAMTARST
jgi:hypothetical protein